MDDFGSGYSSLNMLSQMTLDILKLDMKFIQAEIDKPAEQSILNDIISMAHRMHLSVVAEGVETIDQVEHLHAMGCDYVQGYGHEMGDRMLRIKTRSGDIHCRYGGDEFILVLRRMVNPEAAVKKSAEICRAFHDFLAQESLPAACSGGVILCGEGDQLSAELIERADRALYRAKWENKGGCCLWSAEKDG